MTHEAKILRENATAEPSHIVGSEVYVSIPKSQYERFLVQDIACTWFRQNLHRQGYEIKRVLKEVLIDEKEA